MQNWLTALLLMLMQRVVGNCSSAGAPGRGRHPTESSRVELVEVFVIVMQFYSGCLRTMLSYIGHLLLLGQHLNLHLLLLWKRHEVVEYVTPTIAVMRRRHIFSVIAITKVKLSTIR